MVSSYESEFSAVKSHNIRHLAAKASSIDGHVGGRIREARMSIALTGAELAAQIGIAEDRLALVEEGQERIGSGELFDLASHLDRPISYFFS